MKVPCANATASSCGLAADVRAFDKAITIGGDSATTYMVKLKICGVFETRPYNACKAGAENPRICIDGTPATTPSNAPTYPTLGLKIAAPARTYWLNGMWEPDTIVKFEYSATFEMKGGTTVNVVSDGGNNANIYTGRMKNVSCPAVPASAGIMQPYGGQFIHFKVESVSPMN
jgi:hypothetical protein